MDIDLATLPDDVETLQRMVRRLAAERTALSEAQAEIERLRLIVRKLQRSQFGRRAERLDDDQLQLGFEDLGVDIARAEATLPPGAAKSSRARSQTDRPSLPARRRAGSLDPRQLGWRRGLVAGAAAGETCRARLRLADGVRRRHADPGARSRPRPHQDWPALGLRL